MEISAYSIMDTSAELLTVGLKRRDAHKALRGKTSDVEGRMQKTELHLAWPIVEGDHIQSISQCMIPRQR